MAKIDTRLFTFAGSSADQTGMYKARFANDLNARPKVLKSAGNTDLVLVPLPRAMTKSEALAYLLETKPVGVNLQSLHDKVAYIAAQEAKIAERESGIIRKRGRPAKVRVDGAAVITPKKTEAQVAEVANSIVNDIVNNARRGSSIRAKAQQVAQV